MDFWVNLLTGIVTVFGLIYGYFVYSFLHWEKKNIPYSKPSFPFGNIQGLAKKWSMGQIVERIYKEQSNAKAVGIWLFAKPALIIRDLTLIKTVLMKEFTSFHDRGFLQNSHYDPLTGHLFFLEGQKWRNLRIKLTPTFTSGKMKMMFPTVIKCGVGLKESLLVPAEKEKTVDVKEYLSSFTSDVIASCAFGLEINAFENPDSEFRKTSEFIFKPSFFQSIKNTLSFAAPRLAEFFQVRIIPKKVSDFFISAVEETMAYREENNVQRKDFLQLLIELKNKGKIESSDVHQNERLEEEECDFSFTTKVAAAQAFVFFIAGFETSSTAMSFCLYELARHPDIQERLRREVDKFMAMHNGQITYDSLQEMTYLEQVVSETLRLYPPAPLLIRECTKSCYLEDVNLLVEKGTRIFVPVQGVHHDPNYYPDPLKFNPDRFSLEERQKRDSMTYFPFGDGPRACIGMRFALMQTKVGVSVFLSNYKVEVAAETPIPVRFDPKVNLNVILGGMHLKVSKRS